LSLSEDILTFWFKQAGPKTWFSKSDAFDSLVRTTFETQAVELAANLSGRKPRALEETPDGSLALIIALDQFPRNMYRDTKAMFAWDDLALTAAKRAVEKGFDFKISQDRRAFIYMPYMHSENLSDQDLCVTLCDGRLTDENTLRHAKAHRTVIERFGRFPHRNKILGRDSTAAEIEFLKSGGYAP